jgi:general secretion pathway protein E
LRQAAVASGMRTMYADGTLKALAGITTIEEVMRVTSDN